MQRINNLICLDLKESKRFYNASNHLVIRDNPIAKSGVFEYLREEVEPNTKGTPKGRDIVKVYRPFSELIKAMDSFKNAGVVLTHKWVEPTEMPHLVGSIGSKIEHREPYLFVDMITIYDKEAINAINSGEARELSPGYTCDLVQENGITGEGEAYEFKQTAIKFNHLALVSEGRSGKDLKILDKSMEVNKMSKFDKAKIKIQKILDAIKVKDEDIDKREVIREVLALATKPDSEFNGGENEKIDTIIKLAEKLSYDNSLVGDENIDKKEEIKELAELASKPDSDFSSESEKFDTILKILEKLAYNKDEVQNADTDCEAKDENVDVKDDINSLKVAFAEFAKLFQEFLNQEKTEEAHNEVATNKDEVKDEEAKDDNKTMDFNAVKEQLKREIKAENQRIVNAFLDVKPYVGDFNYEDKTEKEIYDYALRMVNPNCSKVQDSKSAFHATISVMKNKNEVKAMDSANDKSKVLDLLKNIK